MVCTGLSDGRARTPAVQLGNGQALVPDRIGDRGARKHHLAVIAARQDKLLSPPVVVDLETDYRPLAKELAYRAVARHPEFAGRPFVLAAELEQAGAQRPVVCLRAFDPAVAEPLTTVRVPAANFAWLGLELAERIGVERGTYTVYATVVGEDHPWVAEAEASADDDFEITERSGELCLPSDFSQEPVGPLRVVRNVGSWMDCVFSPPAWRVFIEAASRERVVERGWAGAGRVHLANGRCSVVIDHLSELPAVARRESLVTHGTDLFACQSRLPGRLAAYLHLHPPMVGDTALGPYPSGPDHTVAWNLDASTQLPVVLPIAMFGAQGEANSMTGLDVAAHGYVGGVLQELNLEVLTDGCEDQRS